MLANLLLDCARNAWRQWLKAPIVSLIVLLGFTVAAASMQVSAETARQLKAEAAATVPRDLLDSIGYLKVRGASGVENLALFDRTLFERILGLPQVQGVFAELRGKGILVDGDKQTVSMVVFGGLYPFCSPAGREALARAAARGLCAVNQRLTGPDGGTPRELQAFPSLAAGVGAVIGTGDRLRPQPTLYSPLGLLPLTGGMADLGLVAHSPEELSSALDAAEALLRSDHPGTQLVVLRQTEVDRLGQKMAGIRAVVAAYTGISVAILVVAVANLGNLFALLLLRQSPALTIRRALGAPRGAVYALATSTSAGLGVVGVVLGCFAASLAGRRWLGLPAFPALQSVLLTLGAVSLAAVVAVFPLVRRLAVRDPGLALRERL